MKHRKTVVLDLDDVVFDLKEHSKEIAKRHFNVSLTDGDFINYNQLLNCHVNLDDIFDIMRREESWSTTGMTLDFARHKCFINSLRLKGIRIVFSTARGCWGDINRVTDLTEAQLKRNNIYYDRVVISDKGAKLKGINNVVALVDDLPDNLEPYIHTDIRLYILKKPWNYRTIGFHPVINHIHSIDAFFHNELNRTAEET